MKRKNVIWLLAILLLITVPSAAAQQTKKVPRIGYLDAFSPAGTVERVGSFVRGLRDLGWVEGQNIIIEYRYAEGKPERLAELAADLVHLNVDIIVVQSNTVARVVADATKTIPIVMADGRDPVATGLAASLARPGGNVTGMTNLRTELAGKKLELLKETVPKHAHVAAFWNPAARTEEIGELKAAAPSLKIQLHVLEVRVADELEKAFREATKARAGALIVTTDPTGLFTTNRKQILELAVKNRLPAMYPVSAYVNAGGLMSYAADVSESFRRAATYVDKILKGAKPGDLPIERPMKFELIINLQAAKQIGLTIPPNVLARANRVIK
jgi:putative tryptophan/tyrosine transport system substrate-binding protein